MRESCRSLLIAEYVGGDKRHVGDFLEKNPSAGIAGQRRSRNNTCGIKPLTSSLPVVGTEKLGEGIRPLLFGGSPNRLTSCHCERTIVATGGQTQLQTFL